MSEIVTVTLNPAIDQTIYCKSLKIGETNYVERSVSHVAGKGINVSRNLLVFEEQSTILGVFAGTKGSKCINSCANNHKVISVITEGETRTNLKIVDQNGTTTEMNEKGPQSNTEIFKKVCEHLETLVKNTKIFVFSGSVPPGFSDDSYSEMIEHVKKHGAISVLDTSSSLLKKGIKAMPTLIKPNIKECQEVLGLKNIPTQFDLLNLRNHWLGVDNIVVSMGEKGAFFILKELSYYAPGLSVVSKSTTGAGDAMVASLTYSLLNNEDDEVLIRRAVATSAAAVETEGTVPGTLIRIKELMNKVTIEKVEEIK